MQITIDTAKGLSTQDVVILQMLVRDAVGAKPAQPQPEPAETPDAAEAPAQDGGRRRRTKEQMEVAKTLEAAGYDAEDVRRHQLEGVPLPELPGDVETEETPAEEPEEDLLGSSEEEAVAVTLDDILAEATKLVTAGQQAKVKAILTEHGQGAVKVSALKPAAFPEFYAAIVAAVADLS